MAKHRLLFIFSLLLSASCIAQTSTDSLEIKRTVVPSIYIDYGKLFTIATNFETKYEGGIELLFKDKYPFIIEIGQASLSPEGAFSNGTYSSEGVYFRVGGGYYTQFNPKTKIGLSARFAVSTFSEDGRIFIESPSGTQDTFVQSVERDDLQATWYEIVGYSDQKLSDMFTIGLNIRFRILGSYDKQDPIDVYAIPGYGRSFDSTVPAANLFLKVTF